MELKEKLEILIKRNGYKKTDFANTLGITYRALANYISGARKPRANIISDIAVLLDTDVEILTDNSITLELTSDEKLYFGGTSSKAVLDTADDILKSIDRIFADKGFTEEDKTAFFGCIAEKYFADKAKKSDLPIDNELIKSYNTNS